MMELDELLPKLEKALEYGGGTHTPQDVAEDVRRGDAQAWERNGGFLVTFIEEHPQEKVLFFWIAAGELEACIELAEEVYEWGRAQGCTRARLLGRKGWAKPLAAHGWTPGLVEYTKEL